MDQPQALAEEICDKCLHFATEATVITISHFSNNPHKYAAHPFVVSRSCKHEDVPSQKLLLQTAITAANTAKIEGCYIAFPLMEILVAVRQWDS
ncbi:hypothetical protein BJV74DRAFT_884136 [Russula compacta]|nr:hypothetical protein BJV74DRAFT_884136 [Russula compacta]